jgi:hypothetical protein
MPFVPLASPPFACALLQAKAEVALELRAKVASLAFARLEQRLQGYEQRLQGYEQRLFL